jgi:hypothetical protein
MNINIEKVKIRGKSGQKTWQKSNKGKLPGKEA